MVCSICTYCCRFIKEKKCHTIYYIKNKIQKLLTILDIVTDVRTCYIMYFINPYWYTIMLSAILTPFIVFWASSYNFKNVTNMLEKTNNTNSISNKILALYLTCLSFPVIGVILTIIEIIGCYILDFFIPLIKFVGLGNNPLIRFWIQSLNDFKSSNSVDFFTISELFFESIPQVILQLWIFVLYPHKFIDSNGKEYLTTFDILLSLGAAVLNIIMNIHTLNNRANSYGLDIKTYIPYFMGSQLDKVIKDCMPVKNWAISSRYLCNLGNINIFYTTPMVYVTEQKIREFIENPKQIPKKIVIPWQMNNIESTINTLETDIKRGNIAKLIKQLKIAQTNKIIAVDINDNDLSELSNILKSNNNLYIEFINNSSVDISYEKEWYKCSKNRYKQPILDKISKTFFNENNSPIENNFLEFLEKNNIEIEDENSDRYKYVKNMFLHINVIKNLYSQENYYLFKSKSIIDLIIIGLYCDYNILIDIIQYLDILYDEKKMGDNEILNEILSEEDLKWLEIIYMHSELYNKINNLLKINVSENIGNYNISFIKSDNIHKILIKYLCQQISLSLNKFPPNLSLRKYRWRKIRPEIIKLRVNSDKNIIVYLELFFDSTLKCYLLSKYTNVKETLISSDETIDLEKKNYLTEIEEEIQNGNEWTDDIGNALKIRFIPLQNNNWIILSYDRNRILTFSCDESDKLNVNLISKKGYIGNYPKDSEVNIEEYDYCQEIYSTYNNSINTSSTDKNIENKSRYDIFGKIPDTGDLKINIESETDNLEALNDENNYDIEVNEYSMDKNIENENRYDIFDKLTSTGDTEINIESETNNSEALNDENNDNIQVNK